MFGFKKSVTPDQFGEGVLYFANDFITADASRSLGARFENYDASKGWVPVFQANGVPIPTVKLYHLFYTHAVLQAYFRGSLQAHRLAITRGAMSNIADKPAAYDFGKTFNDLEAAFDGRYQFDPNVAALRNQEGRPMTGVAAAKYLVDTFVLANMKNRQAFINDFAGYSSTVCATVGTIHRATEQLLTKVKIVG
ncbi:hypothetical protein JQ612_02350 [Bradyrhizobium manausense]|uniref:hypothetical protein n=1 Tax=Bradyrhizobium manausense TaxID=989370 RepID=UPI001BA55102|nr:hypothetical protein [Bradyrhizobium manausense]MBR0832019.1 hypothetical protein [Bradyrhizobium manausense]